MAFKRPGTVPFKWEVQPGIPKQQDPPAPATTTAPTPRLALPPAARVVGAPPCRRTSSWTESPAAAPQPSHRRSMSARFATSLVLMPFTWRGRGAAGARGRAGVVAAKDDASEFCLLYAQNKMA